MALKEIMHDEIQEDIDAAVNEAVNVERKRAQEAIQEAQNDAAQKVQEAQKEAAKKALNDRVKTFWDLVTDHILNEEQAAERVGMSVNEFTKTAKAILAEEARSYNAK